MADTIEQFLQPFAAEQRQRHFDAEIALERTDIFGVQETLQVSRCRVWRVKLRKRRGDQKHGNTQNQKFGQNYAKAHIFRVRTVSLIWGCRRNGGYSKRRDRIGLCGFA